MADEKQNNHSHKIEDDFSYTERINSLQTDQEQNTFSYALQRSLPTSEVAQTLEHTASSSEGLDISSRRVETLHACNLFGPIFRDIHRGSLE